MFGSHSEIEHTRTAVLWPWRTLVKVMMPCSAWLTTLVVVKLLKRSLVLGTGSFPMELEFPVWVITRISTGTEDRWWYVCTAEEVERKGSTAVRYLIQWMLTRSYTLECTQQVLVSGTCCSGHTTMLVLQKNSYQNALHCGTSLSKQWHVEEQHLVGCRFWTYVAWVGGTCAHGVFTHLSYVVSLFWYVSSVATPRSTECG